MTTWPSTLPSPAINTFSEAPPNNIIRSSMDKGYDKVRRRTTASIRPISFTLKLTDDQVTIIDDFYNDETVGGSLSFDYIHPRTGATVEARFAEPPSYQSNENVIYDVSVSLEILP